MGLKAPNLTLTNGAQIDTDILAVETKETVVQEVGNAADEGVVYKEGEPYYCFSVSNQLHGRVFLVELWINASQVTWTRN